MRRTSTAATLCTLLCALLLAACGGDGDGDSGSGGSAGSEGTGQTKGAKAVDPGAMDGAKGQVTYCGGKDVTGRRTRALKAFNAKFKSQGLSAKLLEFPESADEQRQQFIQRERAKSPECDVFAADVVWTAEFATQKWLMDLTPYMKDREDEFIPSTLETARYDGKVWGAPETSNAGFLYYRTDVIDQAPTSWQQAYELAKSSNPKGIAYQGAAYEGLTVDFLELAFAAGGKVLNDDGTKSELDSPENLKALKFMVDGVKSGAAPKSVTTYMEEPARRAFEAGRVSMMRNWPYAYTLAEQAGKVKGKFKVMPYPEFEGGGKAGILGGANLVISAYSKNAGGALALLDFLSSEQANEIYADTASPPVLTKTYDDPATKKALPFADELAEAIGQAKPRPVSPVYPLISEAIYKNVNAALSGDTSPEAALKAADRGVTKALATF
jgi:multiple sugar transport system substrate-binding protein